MHQIQFAIIIRHFRSAINTFLYSIHFIDQTLPIQDLRYISSYHRCHNNNDNAKPTHIAYVVKELVLLPLAIHLDIVQFDIDHQQVFKGSLIPLITSASILSYSMVRKL